MTRENNSSSGRPEYDTLSGKTVPGAIPDPDAEAKEKKMTRGWIAAGVCSAVLLMAVLCCIPVALSGVRVREEKEVQVPKEEYPMDWIEFFSSAENVENMYIFKSRFSADSSPAAEEMRTLAENLADQLAPYAGIPSEGTKDLAAKVAFGYFDSAGEEHTQYCFLYEYPDNWKEIAGLCNQILGEERFSGNTEKKIIDENFFRSVLEISDSDLPCGTMEDLVSAFEEDGLYSVVRIADSGKSDMRRYVLSEYEEGCVRQEMLEYLPEEVTPVRSGTEEFTAYIDLILERTGGTVSFVHTGKVRGFGTGSYYVFTDVIKDGALVAIEVPGREMLYVAQTFCEEYEDGILCVPAGVETMSFAVPAFFTPCGRFAVSGSMAYGDIGYTKEILELSRQVEN